MEQGIKQVRRELARVARAVPGRSRRYPEPLRRAAVEVLRHGRAQGLGLRAVARQLGVSAETLKYWARGDRGTIRPVVQVAEDQSGGGERDQQLVLVTPAGYRIEGLTIAQIMDALRVLI